MEGLILKQLGYNLVNFNPFYMLESFLCVIGLDNTIAYKIFNFFIEDERFLDFNALEISCAIISLSRDIMNMEPWPSSYVKLFDVKIEKFMNCYIVIKR
jgi:hypothetical protein